MLDKLKDVLEDSGWEAVNEWYHDKYYHSYTSNSNLFSWVNFIYNIASGL